ncbi:hypothetical protein GRF29_8g1675465 [Pseudopithomyces chartarum]|uniref:Uncharacterized protein n=1 Tax=Pseudopithomyces chartarum TaxID=1892770 RepID=A0AAN6M6P2_9PLEO|nr:hypothetical protein GRF29_8g1675465 [Pseudopithomyces chartarum]
MRSSVAFFITATITSIAAATPLDRRYEQCSVGQQWHICGDGWKGCCSISPCRGANLGSKCPDPRRIDDTIPAIPTTTYSSIPTTPTPSAAGCPDKDTEWMTNCNEDNSNCNWNATFYSVKTGNESFAESHTDTFYVTKEQGSKGKRRDVIAVYKDLPSTVTKCTVSWYKPTKNMFYGTFPNRDGAIDISTLDTGDKTFMEAVGEDVVNYGNTKDLIAKKEFRGVLDLGNWGFSDAMMLNGKEFDCSGGELVLHLALNVEAEASVVANQVAELGGISNGFVQRAGWVIRFK